MLATDLHNPHVKNRMTKDQYINNLRGVNDSKDLPRDYLSEVFDDIAARELDLKPSFSRKSQQKLDVVNASYRQRKLMSNMQLVGIAQNAHALMEQVAFANVEFLKATHYEHVRPMFTVCFLTY